MVGSSRENGRFTVTKMTGYLITYSYSHLLVITGYKWDYTFYKWGFLSTYNWYNLGHNCNKAQSCTQEICFDLGNLHRV